MTDPVDSGTLTATQCRCLELFSHRSLHRVQGGYRLVGSGLTVSLKTIDRLEALGLTRRQTVHGGKTVVLTGSGRRLLSAVDAEH